MAKNQPLSRGQLRVQMIVGVAWLIVGVWFAVGSSVPVWLGIVLFGCGVVYLVQAIRRARAGRHVQHS